MLFLYRNLSWDNAVFSFNANNISTRVVLWHVNDFVVAINIFVINHLSQDIYYTYTSHFYNIDIQVAIGWIRISHYAVGDVVVNGVGIEYHILRARHCVKSRVDFTSIDHLHRIFVAIFLRYGRWMFLCRLVLLLRALHCAKNFSWYRFFFNFRNVSSYHPCKCVCWYICVVESFRLWDKSGISLIM